MFSQDFREFIELLIKNKAEYLIVGGYAVGIHGHPRYTGILDIWLNPIVFTRFNFATNLTVNFVLMLKYFCF